MSKLEFTKMNATGNDFIVIDNRNLIFSAENRSLWAKLCKLKTGVGADGVLLLEKSRKADFKMRYINADGGEVEMCGNGARAITSFAHEQLQLSKVNYTFETMNGVYQCSLDDKYGFRLKMTELYDVDSIALESLGVKNKNAIYMNTGVPHSVFEIETILAYPVFENGKRIRYSPLFKNGCNANFYEVLSPKHLKVRTYERGVEDETLSCGTGVTATAIAAAKFYGWKDEIIVETMGGQLAVEFNTDLSEIYLCGKVEKVFSGSLEIS